MTPCHCGLYECMGPDNVRPGFECRKNQKCYEVIRAQQQANEEAMSAGFVEGIEAAAKVVDECNRAGPYQAIAAASIIRALKPPVKVKENQI